MSGCSAVVSGSTSSRVRARLDDYFQWTGQQPVINLLRFHCAGVGEIAPVRREVLRKAGPIRSLRPYVHVG